MANFNDDWKVESHGPLEQLDDRLFSVEGEIRMPLGMFPRRMTVIGLSRRRVAIWSPVPLHEPEMRRIEALGEVAFLIVPGASHRRDIKPWKQRYPKAKVVCAPGARKAVEERVPVDATEDVLDDPAVRFETVAGVGAKEAALLVTRSDGVTLVVNDILANVRHPHGIGANILARVLGFGVHAPQMPRVGRRLFVEDERALGAAFRRWSEDPSLVRIIVSHGDVLAEDPRGVLMRMAEEFDGDRKRESRAA